MATQHFLTGSRLDPDQIINLILKAPNIDKPEDVNKLMYNWKPSTTIFQSTKRHMVLASRDPNDDEREQIVLRYVFIGSKTRQTNPLIGALHIMVYGVYYGISMDGGFIKWLDTNDYIIDRQPPEYMIDQMTNIILTSGWMQYFLDFQKWIEENQGALTSALYGPYVCLLGKKLNAQNCNQWGERCVAAMLGSIGDNNQDNTLTTIIPTLEFATNYHSRVVYSTRLRSIALTKLLTWKEAGGIQCWVKNLVYAQLARLAWTELTGFRLIMTYLVRDKPYFWLWGYLAISCPDVINAVDRFLEYKEKGPFLKLVTSSNDNAHFNTPAIKRMAEIARLIGIILGTKSLENVNVGYKFENEEEVKRTLKILMTAGDRGMFKWSKTASNHILPEHDNKEFYETVTRVSFDRCVSVSESINNLHLGDGGRPAGPSN